MPKKKKPVSVPTSSPTGIESQQQPVSNNEVDRGTITASKKM